MHRACCLAFLACTLPAQSLREAIERFTADRDSLARAAAPAARQRTLLQEHQQELAKVDFDQLDPAGRIDWLLLDNHLRAERRELEHREQKLAEIAPLLPFAATIENLAARARRGGREEGKAAAEILVGIAAQAASAKTDAAGKSLTPALANRAAQRIEHLRGELRVWHRFHDGYAPLVSWWTREPMPKADQALAEYAGFLRERFVGQSRPGLQVITGDPIGRQALLDDLAREWIPYTPEELVTLAGHELAWCRTEMRRAAQELGCGDDVAKALELVKNRHVAPGEQPQLITDLAEEAILFLEERDLVTIPALCKETWRVTMMSPQRQLVNPFFLGGEVIQVSYPTDTMTHADKLMSMRGNNRHFARATVHHELIPGHHLQGFVAARERPYRRIFDTPFYGEGWALYWEMLLWDLGFAKSPEDRLGMLFWRSHRCTRIVFSLGFHLGTVTPQQAIDLLVDQVGHERANAEAEVRRSFGGDYPPLYQAAYMLGGLQLRALRQELAGMPDKAFHDAVLRENSIPIELVRAALAGKPVAKDLRPTWRFAAAR